MENKQPKLNTLLLAVTAASLLTLVYLQLQPSYAPTGDGRLVDTRSGKIYRSSGNSLVPATVSTDDRLRQDFPDGKHY